MKPSLYPVRPPRAAFTLLELLIVIVVITLLMALLAPATTQVIQGSRLGSAASTLANELNLARMTAVKMNQPVEVRFFSYAEAAAPGSEPRFRAWQIWSGDQPGTPLTLLGEGVVFATGTSGGAWSSLVDGTLNGGAGQEVPGEFHPPGADSSRPVLVSSFQFRPDGSVALSASGRWCLTLAMEEGLAGDRLPDNFITLVLDPVNGSIRTLRPG